MTFLASRRCVSRYTKNQQYKASHGIKHISPPMGVIQARRTPRHRQKLTRRWSRNAVAWGLAEYLQQRVSMVQQGSNTNFWDVALTLCTICAAVAHGRPVHGFFHVWRVARVVVVRVRIGACSLGEAFVYVPSVKGTGEGAFGANRSLNRWEALGCKSGDAVVWRCIVGVGRHGGSRHCSR